MTNHFIYLDGSNIILYWTSNSLMAQICKCIWTNIKSHQGISYKAFCLLSGDLFQHCSCMSFNWCDTLMGTQAVVILTTCCVPVLLWLRRVNVWARTWGPSMSLCWGSLIKRGRLPLSGQALYPSCPHRQESNIYASLHLVAYKQLYRIIWDQYNMYSISGLMTLSIDGNSNTR